MANKTTNNEILLPQLRDLAEAVMPAGMADREAFCLRLQQMYGSQIAADIVTSMRAVAHRCFWINPLRPSSLTGADFGAVAIDELPDVFCVGMDNPITQRSAAENGELYIQNPASFFAVRVLAPTENEEVLDLAAAPGGKTIAMAARMQNTGRIAAVEPIRGRFHRMQANLSRCGVTNVQFYLRDGRGVGRAVPERFDRVLLDAPCSSESRMRWQDPKTYQHWSLRKVRETQRKQRSLLRSAYAALKPGGVLVYCTCSFAPEENEVVVDSLLGKSDAQLLSIDGAPRNSLPGLTHWAGKNLRPELTLSRRILPNSIWDGFYLARIAKPEQPLKEIRR